jgi:hypothetical protein
MVQTAWRLSMITVETIYCAKPIYVYVALPIWTALWALIGVWIGRRPQPTRLVFVPERERGNYEDVT